MTITVTDLFCGAGGSGLGATAVSGVELVMAANHSPRAIETHQLNFQDCRHDIADISQVEPRRYPRTNILWASPECTNHSIAKGHRATDELAERSRSTMWDVPRFAEVHAYDVVIVENVVDVAKWPPFRAWLLAMDACGYEHEIVYLNSMHAPAINAPRAPQSRDRLYVVFTRKGNRRPDLEIRPAAYCQNCQHDVAAIQTFKPRTASWPMERWGRYRAQYVYRCPNVRCAAVVEPHAAPASSAINWDLRGQRIGDRTKPLSPRTMARIEAGLARYARPQLIPAGGSWNESTQPVHMPFRTRTTREAEGLLVPLEGREGKAAFPTSQPMRTQSTRAETGIVLPYNRTGVAHPTDHALPTMLTRDTAGLVTVPPFIAELRGGGSDHRPVTQPLATVCASGNHHMLVESNAQPPAVEDCEFRMLAVEEIQAAMAFRPDYVVTGSKRERIRQLGNGVTPPAAEWLIRAVVASLEGAVAA